MMILCFASFYPKFQEKKRGENSHFCPFFRTREKDFLVNAHHRHRVRFMTMLFEERDERISDGDIDGFDDEY